MAMVVEEVEVEVEEAEEAARIMVAARAEVKAVRAGLAKVVEASTKRSSTDRSVLQMPVAVEEEEVEKSRSSRSILRSTARFRSARGWPGRDSRLDSWCES